MINEPLVDRDSILPPPLHINTFGAEGRKSTSLATIRWVRKDVDLRPRKNFISWVRVSIQMLLQGRKIYVFVLCE